MLADESKTYEAVLLLGVKTDTQDTSGTVLERRTVQCSEEEIYRCAESFLGDQMQIPPMYSALKQNGKRLYELARAGKEVERAARAVHFYEVTVLEVELPRVWLRITCSKGTYIRTLCQDIGEKLGCGGCMEHLTRTRVGRFEVQKAVRLDQVKGLMDQGRIHEVILPLDGMFEGLSAFHTLLEADKTAHNGGRLKSCQVREKDGSSAERSPGDVRMYDSGGKFLGIYRYDTREDVFYLVKMFYDEQA